MHILCIFSRNISLYNLYIFIYTLVWMVFRMETIPDLYHKYERFEALPSYLEKEGDRVRIGFIGAGRVGYTMGKYLKEHGSDITGYYSRTKEHAKDASRFTDTGYFENAEDLIKESDAVFLTVSDRYISYVFDGIKDLPCTAGKIICHTSGSISSEVFNDTLSQVYGYSVHPMYAVSDKYTSYRDFSNAFITIEGNEKYLDDITSVFISAGLKTGTLDTASKVKYHAASVAASNLVCGMYGFAMRLLTECGFDEESAATALNGLFLDNAKGIVEKGVTDQLTGPLERGDISTMINHLKCLDESSVKLYKTASSEVLKIASRKNLDRDYSEIEELLK